MKNIDASKLTVISWNVEGFSQNFITLYNFVKQYSAQLIFLSEPQTYRCDLPLLLSPFIGEYETHLNSEDAHDMDLPLTNPKAKGGTMALWHSSLSPYLKVLPTTSPSFFSVLISVPGYLPALHTAAYLPTAGRDGDWLASVVELEDHVRGYIDQFSGHLATFLRGDLNASSKNKSRAAILSALIGRLELAKVSIDHPTYHHFTGGGSSDSDLDVLLYGGGEGVSEQLVNVECKNLNPVMFSHHDLLVSNCFVPQIPPEVTDMSKHIIAPRIPNERFSTKWCEDGVAEYRTAVAPLLSQIQAIWGSEPSSSCISLLLSTTYSAMNLGAKATNKVVMMSKTFKQKPTVPIPSIAEAAASSLKDHLHLKTVSASPLATKEEIDDAASKLRSSRYQYKKEVRAGLADGRDARDSFLHNIISNPSAVF